MERKLVKQGRDALTITLPAKWLRGKRLHAGDTVAISEHNNFLQINTTAKTMVRECTIDVRNAQESMIWHLLVGKYVEGYDTITVLHTNPALLQKTPQFFIGMIIHTHTATQTVLKSIISEPENDIDALMVRTYHMLHELATLVEEYSRKEISLDTLKAQERLLDNTVYYCMRYLNKYHTRDYAYRYFLLCAVIEFAGDQLIKIGTYIGKNERLAKTVAVAIDVYTKSLMAGNHEKAYTQLRAFRNAIAQKTFVEGLAYALAENLYNNLGYLVVKDS